MPREIEEVTRTSTCYVSKSVVCDFCGKKSTKKNDSGIGLYADWEEWDQNIEEFVTTSTVCCLHEENKESKEVIICPDCFRKLLMNKEILNNIIINNHNKEEQAKEIERIKDCVNEFHILADGIKSNTTEVLTRLESMKVNP